MPEDLARERGEALHRALGSLPTDMLAPLLRGTRRHADSLVPGALSDGKRGCPVGMMLLELGVKRPLRRRIFGPGRCTIHEAAPEIGRRYPRLAHLEFLFDRTSQAVEDRLGLDEREAARLTGLWMASEVAAEINLRHLEEAATARPSAVAQADDALFADTVARIRRLRPWLTESQASAIVESIVGARRVESLTVPVEWENEVELQRRRLEQPA